MMKMRKFIAVLVLAATVLSLGSGAFAAEWTDVPKGAWYENYVDKVVDAGIMNGTGEGVFSPMQTLNRAMFVTILNRMSGAPDAEGGVNFTDVVKGAWYDTPVRWASKQGIVNGYTDGRFGINDALTREQMLTILYRYIAANGKAEAPANALDRFSDKDKVSAYALDAYRWAVSQNVFYELESGVLNPKGACTRGEAAAVIARFMDCAEKSFVKLTRADLEKAVVELSLQYMLKAGKFQYDSMDLGSVFTRFYGGHSRLTEKSTPEDGTSHTTIYSVCSDYIYKAYLEAIGFRMFDAPTSFDVITDCMWKYPEARGMMLIRWANDPSLVTGDDIRFGATRESLSTLEEMRQFFRDWKTTMRPGDVIMGTGHTFVYVGGGYVLDCAGGKYDMGTGMDKVEGEGAVKYLHPIEEVFLSDDGIYAHLFSLTGDPGRPNFIVFRPLNAYVTDDGDSDPGNDVVNKGLYTLPEATKTRLQYSGMEIDRTVNITPYGSTFTGDTLTYNVAVSNMTTHKYYVKWKQYTDSAYAGEDYKGIVVTEKIPAGTELVEGSVTEGGTYSNGTITWTVDIAAGKVKNLSYKVKVTAAQGSKIVSGGGWVGKIPSNTIVNAVGGKKLGASAVEGLRKFSQTIETNWRKDYNISLLAPDTVFAERVYAKAAGLKLELPTVQQMVDGLLESKYMTGKSLSGPMPGTKTAKGFVQRTSVAAEYRTLQNMLVPGTLGGKMLCFADNDTTIKEFKNGNLEVGDILIWANLDSSGKVGKNYVLVVTGAKNLALMGTDGLAGSLDASSYLGIINRSLAYDIFFVLRPSLALADVNAASYNGAEPSYGTEPVNSSSFTPLSAENIAKFKALQTNEEWTGTNTKFAEAVYAKAGLDLNKVTNGSTIFTIINNICASGPVAGVPGAKYQFTPVAPLFMDETWKPVRKMLLGNYRGGRDFADTGDMTVPKAADLQVGDIMALACVDESTYWHGVCLGDNKMIVCEYRKNEYVDYKMYDITDEMLAGLPKATTRTGTPWEYFLFFRPCQGFADINTGKISNLP